MVVVAAAPIQRVDRSKYRSPFDLAFSPDGKLLAVSDQTAGKLVLMDAAGKVTQEVALEGEATGVAWRSTGQSVFVAECGAGSVAEVDAKAGKVLRRLKVGPRPMGVAVAEKKGLLIAANSGTDTVCLVGLGDGKEAARLGGFRQPFFVAVSPDEALAAVGNLIPATPGSDETTSSCIALIDLAKKAKAADLRLPAGGSQVRKLAFSPDGKWLYVVHTVGRTNLPTTQLERGWVNTNAMSIIDPAKKEIYATLLLDRPSEGAADPWGMAMAKDGKTLYVTISGVHQIAKIDLENLHKLLAGEAPNPPAAKDHYQRRITGIWPEIKKDPKKRAELVNDLAALYSADLIERVTVPKKVDPKNYPFLAWGAPPLKGPRGVALSADGKLAVGCYFPGKIVLFDPQSLKVTERIQLGDNEALAKNDPVRRGEMDFHDATLCFQHWLSCATCHPDGRADGMNWDLLNDGLGNPKNTKSMFAADKTPPSMARGVRSSYEVATAAGYRHILFRVVEPQVIEDTKAYISNLPAPPSPYLVEGKLSPLGQKGKAVFESAKTQCATCHPAPLFTDLKKYNVGTRHELDRVDEFDTPTLLEMWRSAPYLHSGAAVTLMDVLTAHNKSDKHGVTSHLKKEELQALVAYLLSL
ncbi:MAG: hypothetical protein AMJ81_12090 [Phycisphaerae bacterium SM23_33]|nr:MAG: hypothetical protein AMJ81_12090 [Phycisphaerae bacterium SM23_33]